MAAPVREVAAFTDEQDAEGGFGFRVAEYQLAVAVHGVEMLLLDSSSESETARDNIDYSNVPGVLKVGYAWRPAESRAFEVMATVAPDS
jgi:hypothetical protein